MNKKPAPDWAGVGAGFCWGGKGGYWPGRPVEGNICPVGIFLGRFERRGWEGNGGGGMEWGRKKGNETVVFPLMDISPHWIYAWISFPIFFFFGGGGKRGHFPRLRYFLISVFFFLFRGFLFPVIFFFPVNRIIVFFFTTY